MPVPLTMPVPVPLTMPVPVPLIMLVRVPVFEGVGDGLPRGPTAIAAEAPRRRGAEGDHACRQRAN